MMTYSARDLEGPHSIHFLETYHYITKKYIPLDFQDLNPFLGVYL